MAVGETVVGFYGQSYWGSNFDGLVEFGIITAPCGAELPENVYDMDELKNTDGGFDVSLRPCLCLF